MKNAKIMARITADLRVDNNLLLDYLHYLFRKNPETGALMVTASNNTGRMLISHLRVSSDRPERPAGDFIASLEFPESRATWDLIDKWAYYDPQDQRRINYLLRVIFDLDFTSDYRKAEEMGFRKKEAVEAFIASRRLNSGDTFDALHKKIYRHQRKALDRYTSQLLNRAAYIDRNIDTAGLNELL